MDANEMPYSFMMSGVEQDVKSLYLKGIKIADPEVSDYFRLDVFIGADSFFMLVHGNHISKCL